MLLLPYYQSQRGLPSSSSSWCSLLLTAVLFALLPHATDSQNLEGNLACPCLTETEILATNTFPNEDYWDTVGVDIDHTTYGIGCKPHDNSSLTCSETDDCTSIVPLPLDCDKSYCSRSWCFVDEELCPLKSQPSLAFEGRTYSYATCGELDRNTFTDRLNTLKDQTLQVAYLSNSGGWKGSFNNPSGTNFATDVTKWTGPVVDFVREAALVGGFNMNLTAPPDWLRPMSEEFFGSSDFDLCVYATSLGYLDFCVAGFSITEKRSSITSMFETTADPYYLIVFVEEDGGSSWDSFVTSLTTIFQPFTGAAWAMIFGAVCVFGLLMFFHEYKAPGSAYPVSEPILIHQKDGTVEAKTRKVPFGRHIANSIYTGILSFFNGSFDVAVMTVGGKINLLAIASFVMIILAVYTANLAAILTQNYQRTSVDSLQAAIDAGYTFCATRTLANALIDTYQVPPDRIVPNPENLGGDGLPGFSACENCTYPAREMVFEQMLQNHEDPSVYCNAAVAKIEDLEVMNSNKKHCDKVRVGDALGFQTIGIPVFESAAPQLNAIFHKTKNDGAMTKALVLATPENQCPAPDDDGTALTIQQLTGVWVLTFGFAILGIIAKLVFSMCGGSTRGLRRYDQWLNETGNNVVVDGYRYDAETDELLGNEETSSPSLTEIPEDGELDQPMVKGSSSKRSMSAKN